MKTYLEQEEIEMMGKAATNFRDRLLIQMLFRLGCRVSEALGVTVEDIDLSKGTVTIQHLKTRLQLSCSECGQRLGRSHNFCPKCGGKVEKAQTAQQEHRRQRVLPVDNETLKTLKDYIRRGGPVIRGGRRLIFGVNRHRAWQIVKECAEKARLPKLVNPETGRIHNVSPHRLRDAFAVHAVKLDDSGDVYDCFKSTLVTKILIPLQGTEKFPERNIGTGIASCGRRVVHESECVVGREKRWLNC